MKTRRSKVPGHGWVAAAGLVAAVLFLVPVPSAEADAPCDARYTISEDTVRDKDTGLTWQRQVDSTYRTTQNNASAYCESLSLAGADGWRLPTVFELQTLVDESRVNPAIDPTAFPETPDDVFLAHWFWSSSSHALDPGSAWYVDFRDGSVNGYEKDSAHRVRCVR
ncbi:DUF1566 domain-containing protein [Sorangium sp. So ce542]|uniref:Lcl C-terminal domain-containing protein n=1 Tax=Sorangium sp. So ce542 TaxID=3133316 RepID=UPI003F5E4ABE